MGVLIYRKSEAGDLIELRTTTYVPDLIDSTTTEDWSNNATIFDGASLANLISCELETIWINDGICDDDTNIESCQYDGGDCCLEAIQDYGNFNFKVFKREIKSLPFS